MSIAGVSLLVLLALGCSWAAEYVDETGTTWLRTPVGYAHPSCVHNLKHGGIVSRESDHTQVLYPDGTMEMLPLCQHPIGKMPKATGSASFAGGWQAWTTYETQQPSFNSFLGYFNIPDVPKTYNYQTLFMFTGLQNDDWIPGPTAPTPPADFEIIQPVLQYGPSAGGGGEYWTLASWYVTVDAGYLISPLLTVNAGDLIFGNMTQIGSDSWNITGVIQSSGVATGIVADKSRLKTNPWAYCTLEVYSDSGDCTEYPDNPNVYSKLQLFTNGGKVTPTWETHASVSPICGEHATVEDPTHVTLHFSS